jgi:hypothetical protein
VRVEKINVVMTAVFIVSLLENVLSGSKLPEHSDNIRFVNICLAESVLNSLTGQAPEFGPSEKSAEGRE